MKLERDADNSGREILGVNFFGGPKPWKNKAEKFAIKIRHQNSLRNSPAILLKFVGPKIKNSPQIRSA